MSVKSNQFYLNNPIFSEKKLPESNFWGERRGKPQLGVERFAQLGIRN